MQVAKPVHAIYPNRDVFTAIIHRYLIDEQTWSECSTEQGEQHYHSLLYWPVQSTGTLSPATRNIKRALRRDFGCQFCQTKYHGRTCEHCGLFFKLVWCKSEKHAQNVRKYIERKPLFRGRQQAEGREDHGEDTCELSP